MSLKDASIGQQIAIAGAAVSSIITLLMIKYHDRPLFYKHMEGVPYHKGYPLLGNLLEFTKNVPRLYDYQLDIHEKLDSLTLTMPAA
ncbi:hypothetical protein CU097_012153, partial [Rhizopus azygosporus]